MKAFIDDHRALSGVEPICRVLPLAPSTYRGHAARSKDPDRMPARARRDANLCDEVARVFTANFGVCGVRKAWRQMTREGIDVARCTLARLMRQRGLKGVVRGRSVRTTISDASVPCPLDRVNRQCRAPRPNALWVSDFTYVAAWPGFVYVAPPVALPPAASQTDRREAIVIEPLPVASSAGACRDRRERTSSSTLWSRLSMNGDRSSRTVSFTTATEGCKVDSSRRRNTLVEKLR